MCVWFVSRFCLRIIQQLRIGGVVRLSKHADSGRVSSEHRVVMSKTSSLECVAG
mgnify:CR=1 FL=1